MLSVLVRHHRVLEVVASTLTLLIQADEPVSTTILSSITSTREQTVAHRGDSGHIVLGDAVSTEALVRILHTSHGITIGNAALNALSRGHIRDPIDRASQDTHATDVILGAAEPLPLMAAGEIGIVMQRVANCSRRTAARHNVGIIWAWLNRVAAGECVEPSVHLLVDRSLEYAPVGHPVRLQGDGLTLGDITASVIASVDRILENVDIPAVKLYWKEMSVTAFMGPLAWLLTKSACNP
jgi:hypothetical protein